MTTPLTIQLSWPAPQLSPNRQQHHMVLHRYKKAAKTEAWAATKSALSTNHDWAPAGDLVKLHLIAHPKPTGPHPDADNFIASCKGFIDGIAKALDINDRDFEAPTITWADKCERGKLFVVLS